MTRGQQKKATIVLLSVIALWLVWLAWAVDRARFRHFTVRTAASAGDKAPVAIPSRATSSRCDAPGGSCESSYQ